MKTLDFLVIGAQKSGTTTLFKLLSEHPDIYMPADKEAPFFTLDDLYEQGLAEYLKLYFGRAPQDKLWGKVTPHYLNDPRAPERIALALPDVKLIALLRDPAERALSQFRMSVRRGFETRTFEQAIDTLLNGAELEKARKIQVGPESERHTYIVRGEYGRLLAPFYDRFAHENILVLFTSDLNEKPYEVLEKIYTFLGIVSFLPASIGKKFHEGGERERFTLYRDIAKFSLARKLWRAISPDIRSRIWFWVHHHNVIKGKGSLDDYPVALIQRLRKHYCSDAALLEKMIGQNVAWHCSDGSLEI